MRTKAYPRYKPSSIEWIGQVPEDWSKKRLGYTSRLLVPMRDKPEDLTGPIPWIRIEDFSGRYIEGSKSNQGVTVDTIRSMNLKVFPPGTVLCSCSCSMGSTAIARANLISNQTFIGIVPGDDLLAEFLFYFLGVAKGHLDSVATGAIQQYLSRSDFSQLRLFIPTKEEQSLIVSFLDREIGRIDQLVAKKRELIERLKEKRTALISRTVTRGLPPATASAAGFAANSPLKPSGLDWLGDIPKHWEVRKFSRCAFFQEGPGLRNWQFMQNGVRVICVTNITEGGISFANYEKFISEEEYKSTYRHFTVTKGDLLLSSSGNSWGKVATFEADEIAILNTSTIRVNENSQCAVIRSLIGWLLTSEGTREQLGLFMTGSCQPNFGPSHLARVWICVPPLPEQTAIAAYLGEETAKLDALVGKVEEAVERLQEYRAALITAAVTGKIDVRQAAVA